MTRARRSRRPAPRRLFRGVTVGLALGAALAPQFGCGREFFRQWADQDASEAVFEKSRDPRWRIDAFTIEPPALSRFANPYDIDRPPAPPDDRATEALAPTPQWPHHRLLVPQEGTGYLDMLEKGPRYTAPPPAPPVTGVIPPVEPQPPEPATPSPFNSEGNSGTEPPAMSPIQVPAPPTPDPVEPTDPPDSFPPQARVHLKDTGVFLTKYQAPTTPEPGANIPPALRIVPRAGGPQDIPATDGPQAPPVRSPLPDLDPNPTGVDVNRPPVPLPNQTEADRQRTRAATAEFFKLLTPQNFDFNEALASGFPAESAPYVVTPGQALQLALINNRAYQFQLENVYISALAVTLARFSFEPQFYAGLTPRTAPPGGIPQNPQNSFNYRTKEVIGGQNSVLSIGTAAGVGKALSFGGRIVAGYANQTIFNFLSSNPSQPTVTSNLPLTFVQPFLAGGGRALTLEALTQAERNLIYASRDLARFRQTFIPALLTQNQQVTGGGGTNDPSVGYLNVLNSLQTVENSRRTVGAFEAVLRLYQEYALNSAASGISQIQVDQVAQSLQAQRSQLLQNEASYKTLLDQYKMQMGLPPDTPLILDRGTTSAFRRVFVNIDRWFADVDHDPNQLDGIIDGLPDLEPIVIDGRELFRYDNNRLTQIFAKPERQQDFLLAGERVALENRLDLMNVRAQLYDTWRQLAVTANALKGIFDVTVTNQFTTPSTSTNPFGFLDQAKQFSVVLNTELPLIRLSQRNNYRRATIDYQRQQRTLQQAEDNIKLTVRQQSYNLINLAESYELQKTNLLVTVRQRDLSLQQIIAPPAGANTGGNEAAQAQQTVNFIQSINQTLQIQNTVLNLWVQYQSQRLALYRDLGLMPYDEWEAFYEFFPTDSASVGPGAARGGQPAAPGAALNPAA